MNLARMPGKFRKVRESAGLRQRDVGDAVGVSHVAISRFERDLEGISEATAQKAAEWLLEQVMP